MTSLDAGFVEAVCSDDPMGLAFYLAANTRWLSGWQRRMVWAALDLLNEREEAIRVLSGHRKPLRWWP